MCWMCLDPIGLISAQVSNDLKSKPTFTALALHNIWLRVQHRHGADGA